MTDHWLLELVASVPTWHASDTSAESGIDPTPEDDLDSTTLEESP